MKKYTWLGILGVVIFIVLIIILLSRAGSDDYCGDTLCEGGETCSSCEYDCGVCPPVCDNGICEEGELYLCSDDCITCGDGVCVTAPIDERDTCPSDCSFCSFNPQFSYVSTGVATGDQQQVMQVTTCCGDGLCKADAGESCVGCTDDCGTCPVCGNGNCEFSGGIDEALECPTDCGVVCGDDVCTTSPYDERINCPDDCPGGDMMIFSANYDAKRKAAGISDEYFYKTTKYNFDHPAVQKVINKMRQTNYANGEEVIRAVVRYIARTATDYDLGRQICEYPGTNQACVKDNDCGNWEECVYSYTTNKNRCVLTAGKVCELDNAGTTLERGCGWCSSQSFAVAAVLRGMGIATKQLAGCVWYDISCLGAGDIPPLIKGEVIELPDGRAVIGQGSVTGAGGPHSWIMAWSDLANDWIIVESTSGAVKPGSCLQYDAYRESISGDDTDVCYITYAESRKCKAFCDNCY